jgi:hypothetical protein
MCEKINNYKQFFVFGEPKEEFGFFDEHETYHYMKGDSKYHLYNSEYDCIEPEPLEFCPFCGKKLY